MKEIENTTKTNQRIARQAAATAYGHPQYTYRSIWEAYENPSWNKQKAWNYCKELCNKLNGFDLVISSRNTFSFSAVFSFNDPETGVLCYAYITKDYDRYCEA